MRRLLCACLLGGIAVPAAAQRVELPIKAVTLSNGDRRYGVTVVIDGQPVEAGLDTGSTGLRVLAAALPGAARQHGPAVRYGYDTGVELAGRAVSATLGFGTLAPRRATIERVDTVSCRPQVPACAARERIAAADYRMEGDGLPGEGFVAILGIGMRADSVGNPLPMLGVHRWIVDLPRPGDAAPGRLILDPDDGEIARYRTFAFLAGTNQVAGCIAPLDGPARLCAPATIDTGANGLRIQGGSAEQLLPNGTAALIAVGDRRATATMPVTIGRRDQAGAMRLAPARRPGALSLSLGVAPYFHWSILYDADKRLFGVADR